MNDDDKKLAEYKEAAAEERLNAGLLFGQLTVYLASTGGLIQVVTSKPHLYLLALAGILLSIAFYIIGERCGDFAHAARNRAKELESSLGFKLYSSAPAAKIRHATRINASRLIFICGLAGWFVVLIRSMG